MKDRKGAENQMKDYICRLESWSHVAEDDSIREKFPDEQFLALSVTVLPWYLNIINLIMSGVYPPNAINQQIKRLYYESSFYIRDEPFLFKQGPNRVIKRCIPECEVQQILEICHSSP